MMVKMYYLHSAQTALLSEDAEASKFPSDLEVRGKGHLHDANGTADDTAGKK